MADGIITPAITVVSAIEGLEMVSGTIPVLPIAIVIICVVFLVQQFGTDKLGKSFGPIMFLWFGMLGILGVSQIVYLPSILKAFSPVYAYRLLAEYPQGFLLLGAIFLCVTGVEALYSDLGHCGIKNIRMTWIYVKITLILNYLGQGAWLLLHPGISTHGTNPFYAIMPEWFLIPGIVISTTAAIIASQALISGSFSIVNEAILLNFIPKLRIKYPTELKGQMYIPKVNYFLWFCCLLVIIFFQRSSNMEGAYGLSITITMLMTTALLVVLFFVRKIPMYVTIPFAVIYFIVGGAFLVACLNKFMHGGWVTILIAGILFAIMYVWYKGRSIKNRFTEFVKIDPHTRMLRDLRGDSSVPKYATNLIYLTRSGSRTVVESKIITSIFNKQPKRADLYWLIHIEICDDPHTKEYIVTTIVPEVLIRVDFRLGFQIPPRINLYFREVIDDMIKQKEIDPLSNYRSLRANNIPADFRFILIDRIQNYDFDFPGFDQLIMDIYTLIRRIGVSDVRSFGLDTSNVVIEKVALRLPRQEKSGLKRINTERH